MKSKSRVYIVSNGGHDYSAAAEFGELTYCTEGSIRKDDVAQMYRELNEAMELSEPSDFVLVSSLTSLCMVASAIMAAKHGEVHLLLYKDGKYVQRDLMLDAS